ncbi:uncharacterized protein L203_103204 [Cryptococcus depauperatus CBS 7841]|uniref:Uncharacterized protein n=1 Tax=Cryptococcus depauperatus CBS 7841 TaxID=1295531 RepID=A0AAJ8M1T3_9TREE
MVGLVGGLFSKSAKDPRKDSWKMLDDEKVETIKTQSDSSQKPATTQDDLNEGLYTALDRQYSPKILIPWRLAVILPLLTTGCLLYLLTCSAPSWRANWSVVKISVPNGEFGRIYDAAGAITGQSKNNTKRAAVTMKRVPPAQGGISVRDSGGNDEGGQVTINMWGWCVKPTIDGDIRCSSQSMWFNMKDLMNILSGNLTNGTFNSILTHALIVHGFAMLAVMVAAIPVALFTWRTLKRKQVQGGWPEYGILLFASLLCFISWIVDRCLQSNVSSKVPKYDIDAGLASVITGVSSLLLVFTSMISGVPVLYLHLKRQRQRLKYWKDLEKDGETMVQQDESEEESDTEDSIKRRNRSKNGIPKGKEGKEEKEEKEGKEGKKEDEREERGQEEMKAVVGRGAVDGVDGFQFMHNHSL